MGGRGRWRSALCLSILAGLPFALFWRITALIDVFAEGDLYAYNYPLLYGIAEQWRAGELPLWNPYLFGGTPLHGSMQGGAFYPPNVLILFLPIWVALQYSILLHYSLAGVFTFLFLRSLALDRLSAMLGAVIFMLNGFALGHLGHVDLLRAVPWLPLILYGIERWRRSFDRRYVALAAAAMGLMLVAGHPQVPLYALMVAGAYAVYAAVVAPSQERPRVAKGLVLAFAAGAALSAVQVLPTLQLAAQEYLRPTDHSYGYFVNYSLFPMLLVDLVFPRLVQVDEAELAVYVGLPTLLLAAVGVGRPPAGTAGHRRLFVGITAAALILSFGEWTPLSHALFLVPVYNLFSCQARNLFEFGFGMAVLAAFGFQTLRRAAARVPLARRVVTGFVVLLALAALSLAAARALELPFPPEVARLADVTWSDPTVAGRLPVLVASLASIYWFPPRRWRSAASIALLALVVFDLFSYGRTIYGTRPSSIFSTSPRVLDLIKAGSSGGAARIAMIGAIDADGDELTALLGPNINTVYGVESINGFDSAILRQIDVVSGSAMPTYGLVSGSHNYNSAQFRWLMDLLGARYVLTLARETLELAPPRYRPLYEDANVRVFENAQALPRVFLASAARTATMERVVEALASGQLDGEAFDPTRVALVEGIDPAVLAAAGLGAAASPVPPGSVRSLERRAGRVRYMVEVGRPVVFVHSANYSRGWKASLDAASTRLYRVHGLLQGVLVPAGRHEVALTYSPGSFWLGAVVSLVTLLAISAFAMSGRRPTRTRGELRAEHVA